MKATMQVIQSLIPFLQHISFDCHHNDAVIGSNNWTKVARPTASKNNKADGKHEPCKVVPGQITDASPTNTRKSKNTSDNKSELKVKKWSPPEASSQRRKIATDKPQKKSSHYELVVQGNPEKGRSERSASPHQSLMERFNNTWGSCRHGSPAKVHGDSWS
ncbi:LOW QUALITY PROTEIN: hypothetical protein NC653_024110 [Populus alba x Populus x berolinensis]|uniref:Uncharacterized protein n=1 Tax=Populus alba x Populus x berolinensis TaxID=444605 RepID=A0AAD6M8M5_9ROSI|nr:LOW QUALITY PROTEIN: hypothetical protein NC653_024110 [Populus alba x Populus x berolinensis]